MKVCILSMQSIHNFGSLLQSYSLKRILEELGHEVRFIDIERREEDAILLEEDEMLNFSREHEGENGFLSRLKMVDRYFIKRLNGKIKIREQNKVFENFRVNILNISNDDNHKKYDLCVIGSDEVFHCLQNSSWGFTTQLFGNVSQADNVITYAASCGATSYNALPERVKKRIEETFKHVKSFSVRDENTRAFVEQLTKKEIYKHLDPVLVGNFDEEIDNAKLPSNVPQRYCIVYSYYGRVHDVTEIREIQNFCKKHNFEIVSVGGPQKWIGKHLVLTPFEVLKVFKNAEFVVTDTFHGTIFSAKYAKKFAVLPRESNKNKLLDLVNTLEIKEHLLKNIKQLEEVYRVDKEEDRINSIIAEQRQRTFDYLETINEI